MPCDIKVFEIQALLDTQILQNTWLRSIRQSWSKHTEISKANGPAK